MRHKRMSADEMTNLIVQIRYCELSEKYSEQIKSLSISTAIVKPKKDFPW